ncbi:MAG: 3-oxoacyl-ACP reductase FabG [Burkholderiales bacterium]|nr:3-oxoacyl-ACP reductase FabG [Burkholderiales bacterium]
MLNGQVALVTGASRGIGRAVALALAGAGATVVGTATTLACAASIDDALRAAGGAGRGAVLDVRDAVQTEALVEALERSPGPVSILINNAGVTQDALAMRMKDAQWDAVLDTDLSAVFRLCRRVLRGMTKAKCGRIINITSVVGWSGNAGQVNYAAAKAGVTGLTRALAREIGSRNVTVNCVAPGFIETDMTRSLSEDQRQALLGQIPLARLGRAEEVAAAVLFLAGPGGDYITGSTIHVNGGMYMN